MGITYARVGSPSVQPFNALLSLKPGDHDKVLCKGGALHPGI